MAMVDHQRAYLDLWTYAFVSIQSLTKEIGTELDRADGLNMESYDLLVQLEVTPTQSLRLSELAERALLSPSGITRAIDRLERLGYVRREPDATDGRATLAIITEAGLTARAATWPTYRAAILAKLSERLTPKEAQQAAAIFRKLAPDWLEL